MTGRPRRPAPVHGLLSSWSSAVLVGVLVLVLSACSGGGDTTPKATGSPSSSPSTARRDACTDVPSTLVQAVQRYVDNFGTAVTGQKSTAAPSPDATSGDTDLRNALSQTRDEISRRHCNVAAYQRHLQHQLTGVKARGPLANAVFLRLKASLSGRAEQAARTVKVNPGDDLPTLLAQAGPGSTLRLAAGTYRLADTLVLLQGVTLRGAGPARTRLTTRAGGVGLLVLTDGRVGLSGLALEHLGRTPATGLVGGPTSSVVLDHVRVSGAVGGKAGTAGGAGVLMSAQNGVGGGGRGTTLEVTDATLSDNSGAGILLTGRHRVSIRDSRFTDNRQCGVCFTGESSGAVRDSTFTGNAAGVAVLDASRPQVTGATLTGGQVGIQVGGTARPLLRDVRITGAARAAMIYAQKAAGRMDRVTCTHVAYGLVVSPHALPYVGRTNCAVVRSK